MAHMIQALRRRKRSISACTKSCNQLVSWSKRKFPVVVPDGLCVQCDRPPLWWLDRSLAFRAWHGHTLRAIAPLCETTGCFTRPNRQLAAPSPAPGGPHGPAPPSPDTAPQRRPVPPLRPAQGPCVMRLWIWCERNLLGRSWPPLRSPSALVRSWLFAVS